MSLVSYASDSDSDTPAGPSPPPAASRPPPKKSTVTKLVDASNPGKIIVNLPRLSLLGANSLSPPDEPSDEPPAKRARTGPASGSFAGFNAMLPPPKNANATANTNTTTHVNKYAKAARSSSSSPSLPSLPPGASASGSRPIRARISLKTSAEPGFSRSAPRDGDDDDNECSYMAGDDSAGMDHRGGEEVERKGRGLVLPPPKTPARPMMPEGQKKSEDVAPVGNPFALKPLSVSRKPTKKKPTKPAAPSTPTTTTTTSSVSSGTTAPPSTPASMPTNIAAGPAPRVPLFSMYTEAEPDVNASSIGHTPYEPLFASTYNNPQPISTTAFDNTRGSITNDTSISAAPASLGSVADSLNLSASARRELFGRHKASGGAATNDVRFVNMGDEYDRNKAMRASGELQPVAQPVRSIQAGKHSLRQVVNMVHNQSNALEESFARGRNNKREAGAKYGF